MAREHDHLKDIIQRAPRGTWGRIVAVGDDVYGVAADWSDARDAVRVWDPYYDDWCQTLPRVAYFGHSPEAALRFVLRGAGWPTRRLGRRFTAEETGGSGSTTS